MKFLIIFLFPLVGNAIADCQFYLNHAVYECKDVTPDDLQTLNLKTHMNKIKKVSLRGFKNKFDKDTFKMFPNAEDVTIENSEFPKLTNDMFSGLNKNTVRWLTINKNKFESIEPDTFKELRNLEYVEILNNENLHMDINVFKNNRRLKTLGLPASVVKTLNPTDLKIMLPELYCLGVTKSEKSEVEGQIKKFADQNIVMAFGSCDWDTLNK